MKNEMQKYLIIIKKLDIQNINKRKKYLYIYNL